MTIGPPPKFHGTRDILAGAHPDGGQVPVGQLDQAQRRLATTETALEIMGKVGAALAGRPVPG